MSKKGATVFLIIGIIFSACQLRADGTITILDVYDNLGFQKGLKTSQGFSCLIRGTEKTILFDTGKNGGILMDNLAKLGIDPKQIDIIVLSHIHKDHIGGLEALLKQNPQATLYVPKSFLKMNDFLESIRASAPRVIAVTEPQSICRDVYSTGMMGGKPFEQSLVIGTARGSVVITGCAHPGILEIVKKSKEVVKGDTLFVMGGFHLLDQDQARVESVVRMFQELGVRSVGPCHCTGDLPMQLFKERYQSRFIPMGLGKLVTLPELQN